MSILGCTFMRWRSVFITISRACKVYIGVHYHYQGVQYNGMQKILSCLVHCIALRVIIDVTFRFINESILVWSWIVLWLQPEQNDLDHTSSVAGLNIWHHWVGVCREQEEEGQGLKSSFSFLHHVFSPNNDNEKHFYFVLHENEIKLWLNANGNAKRLKSTPTTTAADFQPVFRERSSSSTRTCTAAATALWNF